MVDDNATAPIATETQEQTVSDKPEFVQDKFWDADRKEVNLENLASSYNALEKKLGSRTEDLSKQVRQDLEQERLGKTPEEYKINLPELPENVDVSVSDDMEIVQWWKDTAKKNGLSQEQFDEGVNVFITNAMATLPNVNTEMEKLGDSSKERVEAAELWSKKNLSPEAYNTFSSIASTAEGVKAIEEIMTMTKDSPMPTTPTQVSVTPDLVDLKSMMNDPRYYDSNKRDDSYIKRVTELYEKAYESKK
jgi:basic membrane lipoprotein Med (substrate-binding protein (PBP1-ABC) superfamily)